MSRYLRSRQHGFSLMELMVVITILGILAVLVVRNVFPMIDKARINTAKTDINTIVQAITQFKIENNRLPTSLDELVQPNPKNLNEPYLDADSVPLDPWDNEYVLVPDGSKFEVKSFGGDGVDGGEGVDADISSKDLKKK